MSKDAVEASKVILQGVNRGDMLAQLAEECCELAQAALKLRRTFEGTSPTPVMEHEAEYDFREEIADVLLTLHYASGGDVSVVASEDIVETAAQKEARWARRLMELGE